LPAQQRNDAVAVRRLGNECDNLEFRIIGMLKDDGPRTSRALRNVLADNGAARMLWADWPTLPPDRRNILWWTLVDPSARTVLVEWEQEARAQLARFRAAAARRPDDPVDRWRWSG